MIIPFFIPHAGCPHRCVFCSQPRITGQASSVRPEDVPQTIEAYLATAKPAIRNEVAFYGGSFTALLPAVQAAYLGAIQAFLDDDRVSAIRLSTRPDRIDPEVLLLLGRYRVRTVELGAQSLSDPVLAWSGRGHSAADTVRAAGLLRDRGFQVGIQLMAGLPGDTDASFHETIRRTIALRPDCVRIYPLLVLTGTELARQYRNGTYKPLELDEAVALCRDALEAFSDAKIPVIRMGLPATASLAEPGAILAGPAHPAFRQLVESAVWLDRMRRMLRGRATRNGAVQFLVHPADLSSVIGAGRKNIGLVRKEFGIQEIRIKTDKDIPRFTGPILGTPS